MPLIAGFGVLIHTKSRRTLITVDLTESGEYCIMLNTPNNIGDRVALACFGV